ncbi:hypothetical protein ANTQUA_LOCUS2710 [Anthophora quadrimaculata]
MDFCRSSDRMPFEVSHFKTRENFKAEYKSHNVLLNIFPKRSCKNENYIFLQNICSNYQELLHIQTHTYTPDEE